MAQLPGFTHITYNDGLTHIHTPQAFDSSGYFNLVLYGSGGGFTTASTDISFDVNNAGGTWGSATDVLTSKGNGYGYDGGIDDFACSLGSGPCTVNSAHSSQGIADIKPVPEPASLTLLGTGLLALAIILFRKAKPSHTALSM